MRIGNSSGSITEWKYESVEFIAKKKDRLVVDSSFVDMSNGDREKKEKCVRKSDEIEQVRKLEWGLINTMKVSKKLVLAKKKELKRKKNLRLMAE